MNLIILVKTIFNCELVVSKDFDSEMKETDRKAEESSINYLLLHYFQFLVNKISKERQDF